MVRLVRKDARAPSEELAELRMGDRIGPYLVVRLLAHASLGDMYEVEPIDSDGRVIVKLLDPSYTCERGFEQRLQAVIKATSALKHPGIPAAQAYGVIDGVHYIATERIAGVDLGRRGQEGHAFNLADFAEATEGAIEQRLLADLLDQVLDALAAAHDRGLVHGGVKAGAVLLEERRGRVFACLSDFGLLRAAGENWLRESVERTIMSGPEAPSHAGVGPAALARIEAYSCLSPEQKEGSQGTERSDVYSVGLMAFRVATGYRELGDQLPSDMAVGLSPAWDSFIRTALQRDPAQRFRSAGEMRAALHAVRQQMISGKSILRPKTVSQAEELVPLPPVDAPSPTRRTAALIIVGVCVLITIIAVLAGRGEPKSTLPRNPGPRLEVQAEPVREPFQAGNQNVPVEGVITPVLPPPKAETPVEPVTPGPKPQPAAAKPGSETKPPAPEPEPKTRPSATTPTPEAKAPAPAPEPKPQPAAVKPAPEPKAQAPSAEQEVSAALAEARDLESKDRLAEALSLLSRASIQHPDNARLKAALGTSRPRWRKGRPRPRANAPGRTRSFRRGRPKAWAIGWRRPRHTSGP